MVCDLACSANYRGSYMIAQVFLNLLKSYGKEIEC